MKTRVVVVGSLNVDWVCPVPHLPAPGETVQGGPVQRIPGGKGANQAVAAARWGAQVSMVGSVGRDADGQLCRDALVAEGIDVSALAQCDAPTGVALIGVAQDGENSIIVSSGANGLVTVNDADLAGADLVLLQLEIPLEVVTQVIRRAPGLVCLNAAPARMLPPDLLAGCGLVVVNETERAALGGLDEVARLVVTSGGAGAAIYEYGRQVASATPPRVNAIDTVGAGDTFTAVLGICLAEGLPDQEALRLACAAGAAATTQVGARAGMPSREEIAVPDMGQ